MIVRSMSEPPENPPPETPDAPRAPCAGAAPHPIRTIVVAILVGAAALGAGAFFMRSYELLPGSLIAPWTSPLEGHAAVAPRGPSEVTAPWAEERPPPANSLVIFVVDGLQADAVNADYMPWTHRLVEERGALVTARHAPPTYTRPGLAALLTGAPPALTGVTSNERVGALAIDDLLSRGRRAGLFTQMLHRKNTWVPELFPTAFATASGVKPYMESFAYDVIARVRNAAEGVRAILVIYIGDPDLFAHKYGPETIKYRNAVRATDKQIYNMYMSTNLDRDTFIVVSDHGHRIGGGHGGNEPEVERVPIVLAGAGVRHAGRVEGVRYVGGVTATMATLLGHRPPPATVEPAWTDILEVDDATRAAIDAEEEHRLATLDETLAEVGLDAALAAAVPERWTPNGPVHRSGTFAGPGRLLLAGLIAAGLIALVSLGLGLGISSSKRGLFAGALAVALAVGIYLIAGEYPSFSAVNEDDELKPYIQRCVGYAAAAIVAAIALVAPFARRRIPASTFLAGVVLGPAAAALILLPFGGPGVPPRSNASAVPYLLLLLMTIIAGGGAPLWWAIIRVIVGRPDPLASIDAPPPPASTNDPDATAPPDAAG